MEPKSRQENSPKKFKEDFEDGSSSSKEAANDIKETTVQGRGNQIQGRFYGRGNKIMRQVPRRGRAASNYYSSLWSARKESLPVKRIPESPKKCGQNCDEMKASKPDCKRDSVTEKNSSDEAGNNNSSSSASEDVSEENEQK